MEMEDHTHHHNQYDIDFRQFMGVRPSHFPTIPQPTPGDHLFTAGHRSQLQPPLGDHYDMMMLMPRGDGLNESRADSSSTAPVGAVVTNNTAAISPSTIAAAFATPTLGGLDAEVGSFGGDGGTGRWPRQETLTLLEIRSTLDSKFKKANQKGPLWDEVSRIMFEEHGYQRSGKKCREKFENLYKYYKKTKEGKAGRQDGKHYRFFRQLEALYGETTNPASVPETHFVGDGLPFHTATNTSAQANQEAFHPQKRCDSLSLSNSSGFDTSSSENNDQSMATLMENDSTEKRRKRRGAKGWKSKIKDFIDLQMKKLMEKQEAWLEKLTKALEQKEQERLFREEEWRRQEAARIDREHKFWAKERAWIEARDAAFMEASQKLTGGEVNASSREHLMGTHEIHNHAGNQNENVSETINNNSKSESWQEPEIIRLFQLRTSMESRFQQRGCTEEVLWQEIAARMACMGYDKSGLMCKDKWEGINNYIMQTSGDCNKKRKENSRNCCYYPSNESIYNPGGAYCEIKEQHETVRLQSNDGSSPANSNVGNVASN